MDEPSDRAGPNSLIDCYQHPLTYLLPGALIGYWIVSGVSRVTGIYVAVAVFLAVVALGVYCLGRRTITTRMGLFGVGMGMMGIYCVMLFFPNQVLRRQLLNKRVHLRGTYSPDGTFVTSEIDRNPTRARFFLSRYHVFEDSESRPVHREFDLSLTATVNWPYGRNDFGEYLRDNGFLGVLDVHQIHRREPRAPPKPGEFRQLIRSHFQQIQKRWPQTARFLRALVLGEKEALRRYQRTALKRLGIIHLFVISGLHVGLLFGVIHFLTVRWGPVVQLIGTTLLFGFYVSFLGWPASATRASLMILMWLLANSLDRRTSRWSFFWSAVLLMIVWDPRIIGDVGFQMTVGSVLGIFMVYDYVQWFESQSVIQYALISAGAFFGIMPVLLYHFHYVPSLGILFSIGSTAVFPIALGLIVLQWGFVVIEWTYFADGLEMVFQHVMHFLTRLAEFEGAVSVTDIHWVTVVVLACGLWGVINHRRRMWIRSVSFIAVCVVLAAIVASGTIPHTELRLLEEKPVIIHQSSDGSASVVIPRYVRMESFHIRKLADVLRRKGIRHLRFMISDYPRDAFLQLKPEFTVDRFVVHWRSEEPLKQADFTYNIQSHSFRTRQFEWLLDVPADQGWGGYQPDLWVGYQPGKRCFLNRVNRIPEQVYERVKRMKCQHVLLRERSIIVDASGVRRSPNEINQSVEEGFVEQFILRGDIRDGLSTE